MMRLVKGLNYFYDSESGFMIVACDEKNQYEDVYFTIDGFKFQVTVEDYFFVFPASDEYDEQCLLGFLDGKGQDYWLLGDVFMRGYYSIHDNSDHKNARIGFAPHATSIKGNVVNATAPEIDVSEVTQECTSIYEYWPGNSGS
jgi:hypothetical protein